MEKTIDLPFECILQDRNPFVQVGILEFKDRKLPESAFSSFVHMVPKQPITRNTDSDEENRAESLPPFQFATFPLRRRIGRQLLYQHPVPIINDGGTVSRLFLTDPRSHPSHGAAKSFILLPFRTNFKQKRNSILLRFSGDVWNDWIGRPCERSEASFPRQLFDD